MCRKPKVPQIITEEQQPTDIYNLCPSVDSVADRLQNVKINTNEEEDLPSRRSSPECNDESQNDKNRALGIYSAKKWTCIMCTYENWPKSLKCAMCHTTRRARNPLSCENSPDRDENIGATASNINNYEQEKLARRLRRRMKDEDWRWINACLGVVNGDATPVEGYLSLGGSPTRHLSQAEVIVLNRTSAFETGHTLVHLAIR